MGALTVDAEGAAAFGREHPDWYISPGVLIPNGEGGWTKRPLGRWTRDATLGSDSEAVKAVWHRLVGDGKAIICVACAPSRIWVLDDDRQLAPETGWPDLLASLKTLTLRSCTKGRPHYVFAVPEDGTRPKEGRWDGGDIKSSGIIFIGDGEPILDVPPAYAPQELLDRLDATILTGEAATSRVAASSEEMWDWLLSIEEDDLLLTGQGPTLFLSKVLESFRAAVEAGGHRRQACRDAVWVAAKESAARFYTPDDAYRAIKDVYREMRDETPGAKGWTEDRARDYDLMWAGVIARITAGDLDAEIFDHMDRISDQSNGSIEDLLDGWDAIKPYSIGAEPHLEPESAEALDWGDGSSNTVTVRGWENPDESLGDLEEPLDPIQNWQAPSGFVGATVDSAGVPRLSDSSPVWDTVHGHLAKTLSSGVAEVSDIAILAASLAYTGAHLAGRGTHYFGADAHNPVVWSALIGRSAAARKSMALSMLRGVYYGFPSEPGNESDPKLWFPYVPRTIGGVNSGEILIDSFLAPLKVNKVAEEDEDDPEEDEANTGYFNPRAVLVETELDRLWTAAGRDGSVLSVILCAAWDGSSLSVRSRGAGVVEVDAGKYVLGLVGAATDARALSALERGGGQMAYSGLANRYLWFLLPDETADIPMAGAELPWAKIYEYRESLHLREIRSVGVPVWGRDPGMSKEAQELWVETYPWLKRGSKKAEGVIAKEVLGRAEPQVRRLALNFCLSRGASQVDVQDLKCALGVWDYCRHSVRYLLAPERSLSAPGQRDADAQKSIWSLLSDPAHPGWGTAQEISEAVRKDRGTVRYHITQLIANGVMLEGTAAVKKRGRPPKTYALSKRHKLGTLGPRSEGERSMVGIDLASVRWDH